MEELRSSLKAELLKSWDEIERLEDEKDELRIHNRELSAQLDEAHMSKGALMRQVNELQQQLGQTEYVNEREGWNSDGMGSAHSVCSCTECVAEEQSSTSATFVGWDNPPCQKRNINTGLSLRREEKERLKDGLDLLLEEMERERQNIIERVEKQACRDEFSRQLEDKVTSQFEESERQNKRIVAVWKESPTQMLQHAGQAHQSSTETLHQLQRQIRKLKKKSNSRAQYIVKQNSKMNDYKSYIEDLTSELERIYRSQPAGARRNAGFIS